MASALKHPPADGHPPGLVEIGLDLVPIPAAQIVCEGRQLRLVAANRAFRLAGFGLVADRSPGLESLTPTVAAFLADGEDRHSFDWHSGEAIDSRHYRVTLARSSLCVADGCIASFVDQTSEHRTERSLRREMTTDSLTGLPNRQGFGDLVEQMIGRGEGYAVMVVDLDRFGRINTGLGTLAGDELLISVARRLRGVLRGHDTLARIGGDEFGILMRIGAGLDEARRLAMRLRDAFAAPFRLTDHEFAVEGSIGVAVPQTPAQPAEEVIRHAQFALKRAKRSGRIEAYQPEAFAEAREQFGMEAALRRALEADALRLFYQPICDLATGRIVAFEALARWPEAEGGDVPPSRFIPVAEESGLIVPLGRWAIGEATRALARWDQAAGGCCSVAISVNVSVIQLQRDTLADVVAEALAASGLTGDRIKLELTESALIGDAIGSAEALEALHRLGARLALDDFGTGYSNLARLQQLPIDILKIDQSFVTDMLADRDKVGIVRAILGLAQALGIRTVAEGIETRELAQTLAALGCHYGQGFYYAAPLDEAGAAALLA